MVGVIALGVVWSNVLAFGDVTLAPREQLTELEQIGKRFAGQGPALMTEYQPYAVRHFLRNLGAEGASELRRRVVPLRDGSTVPTATSPDIAALLPEAVLEYRTLVLRRTPVGSRPPTQYRLAWQGRFYEVWQRPHAIAVSAGSRSACAGALRLAGASVSVPRTGRYELWAAGSIRGELTAFVDDRPAGRIRHQVNHGPAYTSLGQVELTAGVHTVSSRHRLSRLRPARAARRVPQGRSS